MNKKLTDWERAVDFHGHECPGLAIGFRASQHALKVLESKRAQDEEILAIVENDACGVDGIQFVAGCTLGKGNLIFRDLGKQVVTFLIRETGKGVRITLKHQGMDQAEMSQSERIKDILEGPFDKYFTIKEVEEELPASAKIFPTVTCEYCGEGVMEPRARFMAGKTACLDCFEDYKSRLLALD